MAYYSEHQRPFYMWNKNSDAVKIATKVLQTDEQIKEEILARFERLPGVDAAHVNVVVKDGTCRLAGTVQTKSGKILLGRVAQSIVGDKPVLNRLSTLD